MWRRLFVCLLVFSLLVIYVEARNKYRRPQIHYPKGTLFWATDFFVRGCKNFLEKCPAAYKIQHICAKSYNGNYKDFANYCEMQYENCNSWRKIPTQWDLGPPDKFDVQYWRVFKREWC